MSLDGSFTIIVPNYEELVFDFSGRGEGSFHSLIVWIVAEENKEKRNEISKNNGCKLTLEQFIKLSYAINDLLKYPTMQKSLIIEDGMEENNKGQFRGLDNVAYTVNKMIAEILHDVHNGVLDSNFIYFKYEFS